jgi:hypothetical protein
MEEIHWRSKQKELMIAAAEARKKERERVAEIRKRRREYGW